MVTLQWNDLLPCVSIQGFMGRRPRGGSRDGFYSSCNKSIVSQFRVGCSEFLGTFSQVCTNKAQMGKGDPGAALYLKYFNGISQ